MKSALVNEESHEARWIIWLKWYVGAKTFAVYGRDSLVIGEWGKVKPLYLGMLKLP